MHGVDIMSLQRADRARESHLGWSQQRLGESQEERHAKNHYHNGYQAADRSRQGDVAETGRGQRRNCKVERIGIVGDVIVVRFLGLIEQYRSSRK